MNKLPCFINVFRGRVKNSYGFKTAIDKEPVKGKIFLAVEGLEGDECAEQRYHGGPERALHQYPSEHYEYWKNKYGLNLLWQAPGMGENLSSSGMDENDVCIGDRYSWGEAIIEVSQPRSPCYKLSRRWGIDDLALHMQDISRCGWLYRVIQPGLVSVDHPVALVERVPDALTIREVCDLYFGDPLNQDGLKKLGQQNRLSDSWQSKVQERLETGLCENWNFRLLGHA
ncbi:MOSC domain-containing protein [Endozoicomonas sp. OPT23]|uniref:MOSC domain-containing protein n=1 Tax=Endozoicomonas sp. OPT23 TaxID=2072845 RepID=UPI00129B6F2A|nr:MOSC domain-containing protein [Endozoicomonas sp. OPT23]MRI35084.1 MOSC domain-containing protein [Endozoicomonas sp. OPT23]